MEKEEREVQKSENAVGFAKSRRKKWLVGAICIIAALLFFTGAFFIGYAARGGIDEEERSLLWMVDAVEKNYHDEVSRDELFDRMYDALALDKFCTHYTPEEYEELINSSNGLNEGFGVSFTSDGGAVRIYRVTQNSPADLAGLKKGMYVYALDGAQAESSSAASSYLGGRESVTLTCGVSADASDARSYVLRRASYHAAYCSYADSEKTFKFRGETPELTETGEGIEGLPADTAYLALAQFEGHAAGEFEACLGLMKARGRKHLILDLRADISPFCAKFPRTFCAMPKGRAPSSRRRASVAGRPRITARTATIFPNISGATRGSASLPTKIPPRLPRRSSARSFPTAPAGMGISTSARERGSPGRTERA